MINNSNNNNNSSKDILSEEKSSQIVNTVPIMEEQFSISKKTVTENVKVEKKWNTVTKKIEVPVSFEEVYVNGKDFKFHGKDNEDNDDDSVLSELNKRIIESFEDMDDDNNHKKQYSILESKETKREVFPLFQYEYNDNDNNKITETNNGSSSYITNISDKQTKTIIPILGEEIVVSKKIVKLGELVLIKNKVTENKKISIDTLKERATIRYLMEVQRCYKYNIHLFFAFILFKKYFLFMYLPKC
jgi:stress response protein YsnF